MVKQEFVSDVPLVGRGAVFNPGTHYEPGDYQVIHNMFLSPEGYLRSRPSVQGRYWESGSFPASDKDYTDFVGEFGASLFVANGHPGDAPKVARSYSISDGPSNYASFITAAVAVRPTAGTDSGALTVNVQVKGFFEYNNNAYAITQVTYRPDGTTDYVMYLVVGEAPITSVFDPPDWGTYTFPGSIIHTSTLTGFFAGTVEAYYNANPRNPLRVPNDWGLFKDRLWVAVGTTLYFSAVSDPTLFTVPDGGFFNFGTRNSITSLEFLNESVYIIGDTSIDVLNYSTDPNLDAEINLISDRVGGDDSTIYGDRIFVAKPNAIYAVSGQNVNKVMDLKVFWPDTLSKRILYSGSDVVQGGSFSLKLEAFEEKLFLIQRFIVPIDNGTNLSIWDTHFDNPYFSGASFNGSVYVIDLMHNGFMSLMGVGDDDSPVCDLWVHSSEGGNLNENRIFFAPSKHNLGNFSNTIFSMGNRSMFPDEPLDPDNPMYSTPQQLGLDTNVDPNDAGVLVAQLPRLQAIIPAWTPENDRFLMKKFRSVQLDLKVPRTWNPITSEFEADLSFQGSVDSKVDGNSAFSAPIIDSYLDPQWNSYVFETEVVRYGINQRGRTLSFHFQRVASRYDLADVTNFQERYFPMFELKRMQVLWTTTSLSPRNRLHP